MVVRGLRRVLWHLEALDVAVELAWTPGQSAGPPTGW